MSYRSDEQMRITSIVLVCIFALLSACSETGEGERARFTFTELESPAGVNSELPNMTRGPDGAVSMSWVAPQAEGHMLRFSRFADGTFGSAQDVVSGEGWFVNWADFPSLLDLGDGHLAAHWLQKEGESTYAYGIRMAQSRDGGASWTAPVAPHTDGTLTEHGFVSLYAADAGPGAVWLDGREMSESGHGGHGGDAMEGMTLRHAVIAPDGSRSEERQLDGLTCDCCQTGVARTAGGLVVVYRDRTEAEVRDISRLVFREGSWSESAPVHEDGWVIPGCPVNGPSVDAKGDRVVTAWFTAADERPRVRAAFSTDGGTSFGGPVTLTTSPEPMGRVDVVMLPDGSAVMSWVAHAEDGAELLVQEITADGPVGAAFAVAEMSAARSSGFPRLEKLDDGRLLVAWTDVEGDGTERRTQVRAGILETVRD